MATTPKYDNDYVTLGYLKETLNTEQEETENKINKIPKNYNSPPIPPYYENSLLMLDGQIYKCIKSRLVGSFTMSDWKIVVSTEEIDEWIKTIYDVNKLEYVDQEDGMIETFYQEEDPSLNWNTDIEKNKHVSDLWTTDTLTCYQYEKKATNPVSYGWKKISVPSTLFDIFDGYKRIFLEQPISYKKDDLWFGETTKIALESSDTFVEEHWEDRDDFIESSIIEQEEYHKIYLLPKITEINRQSIAEIKKAIDEITLTVSQTYTTKTEVEEYIDDVKTGVAEEYTTKEEMTAQIALTSQRINAVVESVTEQSEALGTLLKTVTNKTYVEISDSFEANAVYLSFYGDMHYTYLGETIHLPFFLYDSYLIIENQNSKTKIKLPYFDLNYTDDLYDEFRIEGTRAYIIRRLDGELQPLENETIEELGNISIPLKSSYNKLYMEDFDLNYTIKYNVQNNYTKSFATKAELELTENSIREEVEQKADDKEIRTLVEQKIADTEASINSSISKQFNNYSTTEEMNNTIEQKITDSENSFDLKLENKVDDKEYTSANIFAKINGDTSSAGINANKIKLTADDILNLISGNEINLASKNISISSDNLTVDKTGIYAIAGIIGGFELGEKTFVTKISKTYNFTEDDVYNVQQAMLGNITLTDEQKKLYDVNGNGIIEIYDLLIIQKCILGTISNQTISGTYKLDTSSVNQSLIIERDSNPNDVTSIGIMGMRTPSFYSGNIFCSDRISLQNFDNPADITNKTTILPSGITTPILTQTSKESIKKNFEKFKNGTELIKNADIYSYNLKTEEDTDKKHIGLVINDLGGNYNTPEEVINKTNDGIDLYSMIAVSWQAIKEQQTIIEELIKEIEVLKNEK